MISYSRLNGALTHVWFCHVRAHWRNKNKENHGSYKMNNRQKNTKLGLK